MIKTQYIKVRMNKSTENMIKLDMGEKRGKKPEKVKGPLPMSDIEKEARLYALAKKIGVKIGGVK